MIGRQLMELVMADTIGLGITATLLVIERGVRRENLLPKIRSEFDKERPEGK